MSKEFYLMIVLTAAALLLSGCTITSLVKPKLQVTPMHSTEVSFPKEPKFSYDIRIVGSFFNQNRINNPLGRSTEKALLESFSAYGISDVKKYEKLEPDRIAVIVYLLSPEPSKSGHYFGLPLGLISLATLTIVPYYEETIVPIEVHVIDPHREYDKQIRITRTEYVLGTWLWFPLIFIHKDEENTSTVKLNYQGLRPIFDNIIAEELKNQ